MVKEIKPYGPDTPLSDVIPARDIAYIAGLASERAANATAEDVMTAARCAAVDESHRWTIVPSPVRGQFLVYPKAFFDRPDKPLPAGANVHEFGSKDGAQDFVLAKIIGAALDVALPLERTRCAAIARANTTAPAIWRDGRWVHLAAEEIAEAIEKPEE